MSEQEPMTPGKREVRRQGRRDAIIAVARRSFFENGYSATSMSSICAELGGSKGTMWSYFPSKEELFAAVLDDATVEYRRQLADLLQPSEDIAATLRQFCRSLLAKISSCDAIRLHRLVAAEAGRFPEVGEIFYRRAPKASHELLARLLEQQMAAGAIRRDDPTRAARSLCGLCIGAVQQRMLCGFPAPTPDEIADEADYATELFLRAYRVDGR